MSKIWIGIDPDADKSGVGLWNNKELFLQNLTFFELFDRLKKIKAATNEPIKVRIEAGWLNKMSNWHSGYKNKKGDWVENSSATNNSISKKTGANHETGRKIVEMCEYLGIEYELVKPTSSKLKAPEFAKITKYKGRTNQEVRDAAMLVYGL